MKSVLPLMMALAGCSMPPHAEERNEPLHLIIEETMQPVQPKPVQRPRTVRAPDARPPKADDLCPPKKGETDQERIIRKLDCLLERD